MKLLTTKECIYKTFREYNKSNGITYGARTDKPTISAIIVYKQSNFTSPYTETERSYRVTNTAGKAFFDGMCSNSIYGNCLDGNDLGVRLDCYDWDVEYCYFEQ